MDRQFEDEQDTLRKTLEKRGTSRDEIKAILDRRREGYEADNRPPRVMESVIPKDPSVTKWEAGESFVRAQGYGIYCDGRLLGVMESVELAELITNAHNGSITKKRSLI